MNNLIRLGNAVKYSEERTSLRELSLDNFITTDSILQNKGGITIASNLPPVGNSFPSYKKDNILISNIRPYLKKIWYSDRDGGCSQDVLVLELKNGYNPKFVYYSIFQDAFFVHMMRGKKGTKMPRGDKNQILDYLIPDYDFSTQQKIASVLSTFDSKISLNTRINAELEALAKTIYDYWFVQFDFPDANGKPYKTSGGKMFWNKELKREVPEGWEVKKLREFADTASGGTPLSTRIEYYENGDIPWINSGELNNPYIIETSNFITEIGLKNSSAKLFDPNTLLIALYGATAGKVSLLQVQACTNQAICAIIDKSNIYTYFLKFSFGNLYKYLVNLSTGSARDNLSQDMIKDLKFVIPPEDLLITFNQIANPIIKKISISLKENHYLSTLRDWLLPMLMNGQVKVG